MYKYLTLLLTLCFYQVRSQSDVIQQNTELNIQTKFSQYGGLLETFSRNAPAIAQFNKGQKCLVKSYLGNNKFKIEYKSWVGYVTYEYLVTNDELEDVIKKYKENKDYNAENVNDGIVEETKINIETRPKAKEEKSKIMADEAKAKADEEERIRVVNEAKAKADEEERIRIATESNAIAVQTEKRQTVDKINKQSNKIDQDDFFKKNTELNIQTKFNQYGALYETISKNSQEKAQFNKGQKCLVKSYLGNNKFKIEYKKWLGYVSYEYLVINEELEEVVKKYEEYSAIEIEKEDVELTQKELNNVEAQEKNEGIDLLEMELKHEVHVEKVQTDDKINQESKDIESKELRFTCHYQLNEIDTFYNEKVIKTENYKVSDHLNIELYRIGNKKHVFINFDNKLGCASYFSHSRSYAKIKLENNVVVTIYHSWNVDCDNFSLKGILTNSSISKLKASPIKSIKLRGTKDFIEIENVKYKEFFMDKLECLD